MCATQKADGVQPGGRHGSGTPHSLWRISQRIARMKERTTHKSSAGQREPGKAQKNNKGVKLKMIEEKRRAQGSYPGAPR
jgi:hypothetical protein